MNRPRLAIKALKLTELSVRLKEQRLFPVYVKAATSILHTRQAASFEKSFQKAINPLFERQIKSTIAKLRLLPESEVSTSTSSKKLTAKIFTPEDWDEELVNRALPIVAKSMSASAIATFLQVTQDVKRRKSWQKQHNCGTGAGGFKPGNSCARGPVTSTPEFKAWFGNSKVVDSSGKPLVVYHGTAISKTVFDSGEHVHGAVLGYGSYFTTSHERAATYTDNPNTPGVGGNILPVYLSIKNPLDLESDLTAHQQVAFSKALEITQGGVPNLYSSPTAVAKFSKADKEKSQELYYQKLAEWKVIGQNVDRLKPRVDMVGGEFAITYRDSSKFGVAKDASVAFRDLYALYGPACTGVIKQAGFDGVNRGDEWVAYDSHQIKSATGNNGKFDPSNPDITKGVKCGGPGSGVPGPCPTGIHQGTGTREDPIHCGENLKLAVKLLAEGKHIRLAQHEHVSTLINKMHRTIQKAVKSGKVPPTFDLCKVSAPNSNLFCAEHKGYPRAQMPQMRGIPVEGSHAATLPKNKMGKVDVSAQFIEQLKQQGIGVKTKEIRASHLRASQAEIVGSRVVELVKAAEAGTKDLRERPIFVSRDNYVLDGHHHWAALVGLGAGRGKDFKIPVHVVDVEIGQSIDLANDFARKIGIAPKVGTGQAGKRYNEIGGFEHDNRSEKRAGERIDQESGKSEKESRISDQTGLYGRVGNGLRNRTEILGETRTAGATEDVKVFCATGPGGGVDPTCSSGGGKHQVEFDVLVQTSHHAGFSLLSPKQVVDTPIGKALGLKEETFAEQIGALTGAVSGLKLSLMINESGRELSTETQPNQLYEMDRSFYVDAKGSVTAHNELFRIHKDKGDVPAGQGIKMFRDQVEALAAAGVSKIITDAAGSKADGKDWNGYYTWPLVGYDKYLTTHDLRRVPDDGHYVDMDRISDVFKTKEGANWWRENGQSLDGMEFDLKEGSYSRTRLQDYIDSRAAEGRPIPKSFDDKNCGTGSGGFKPGNTCARGGTGSRVLFEVAPDPNNVQLSGRWNALNSEAKSQISHDVAKVILPKVFASVGVHAELKDQFGGYLNDTNPSFAALLPKSAPAKQVLDVAKMAGFALSQDSMMVVSKKPFEGADKVGFVTVNLPKGLDLEQTHAVYKKLRTIDDGEAVQGHTTVGSEMMIVDFSGDSKKLASKIESVLGDSYHIKYEDGYVSFPQKKDYGYDDQPGVSELAGGGRDAHRFRSEASRIIEQEISRYEIGSAGKDYFGSDGEKVFCATGTGGGIDPTCALGESGHSISIKSIKNEFYEHMTEDDANSTIIMKKLGMKVSDLGKMIGAPNGTEVDLVVKGRGGNAIEITTADEGKTGILLKREFRIHPNDGTVVCDNSLFFIDRKNHDVPHGTGTRILADQVKACAKAGVDHIETLAIRNNWEPLDKKDRAVGYYAWARLGYDRPMSGSWLTDESMIGATKRGLGLEFSEKFPQVAKLSDLMQTEDGRDWWLKNGAGNSMRFDLKEGSLSRRVLDEYVAETRKSAGNDSSGGKDFGFDMGSYWEGKPKSYERSYEYGEKASTATEWLESLEDEGVDVSFDDVVFSTPYGSVPFKIATEYPEWIKSVIGSRLKETFSEPYWADINATTGGDIDAFLEEALYDGWSIEKMADEMEKKFGSEEYPKSRGRLIARTESGNALNGCRSDVIDALISDLGMESVIKKLWHSVLGNTTRDTHADQDGVPADKDGLWYPGGYPARWPGDCKLPARERCNCQCTIVTSFGMQDDEAEELIAESELRQDQAKSFCATGTGGGVDPTCSPGRDSDFKQTKVPTTNKEALNLIADGVLACYDAMKKDPAMAESLKSNPVPSRERLIKNYGKLLRTHKTDSGATGVNKIRADLVQQVEEGLVENLTNQRLQKFVKIIGPQRVVVRHQTIDDGRGGSLEYRAGVTHVYEYKDVDLDISKRDNGKSTSLADYINQKQGGMSTSEMGGTATVLRHEYGHQVMDYLGRDRQREIGQIFHNTSDKDKEKISRYAKANADEMFAEVFAIITHPEYKATDYPEWVQSLERKIDRWTDDYSKNN